MYKKVVACNFLIIGSSKGATTSLWYFLRQHPEVFMTDKKEINFFVKKDSKENEEEYEKFFDKARYRFLAIGEASPIYSETHVAPWIPENIYHYNPHMKLIYIVRHPYERIKSVWKQTLHSGHWKKPIYRERFGLNVPLMPLSLNEALIKYPPFIGACKYWSHIDNYLKYFDTDNILVIYYEDFKENVINELKKIFQFIGVSYHINIKQFDLAPQNISQGKKMERPFLGKIKQNKTYYLIKKLIPIKLKNRIANKYFYKNVPDNFELTYKQKAVIRNELKDEIRLLHQFTGKPKDYWHL